MTTDADAPARLAEITQALDARTARKIWGALPPFYEKERHALQAYIRLISETGDHDANAKALIYLTHPMIVGHKP